MNDHITFDEMSEFVLAKEFNDDFLKMSARINSHIQSCEQCSQLYRSLLSFNDAMEYEFVPAEELSGDKGIIARTLRKLDITSKEMQEAVSNWMKNLDHLVARTNLTIKNFGELIINSADFGFEYPAFAAYAKAYSDDEDEKAQSGVVKSTVIDGDSNRISIGLDGTLSIYFNRDNCDVHAWVLLAPTDEDHIPYFKPLEPYDSRLYVAKFYDITPGDYLVILQN